MCDLEHICHCVLLGNTEDVRSNPGIVARMATENGGLLSLGNILRATYEKAKLYSD